MNTVRQAVANVPKRKLTELQKKKIDKFALDLVKKSIKQRKKHQHNHVDLIITPRLRTAYELKRVTPQLNLEIAKKIIAIKKTLNESPQGEIRAATAMHMIDDTYRKTFEDKTVEKEIRCRKSCSFCCQRLVYVTRDEAELLASRIEETDPQTKQRKVPADKMAMLDFQSNFGPKNELDYWMLPKDKSRCVFLQEKTGECSIYEARPMECRTKYVVSDPVNCTKEATKKGTAKVEEYVSIEAEVINSALADLNKGVVKPMAQAILEVLRERQQNPEAYQRKMISDLQMLQERKIYKGPSYQKELEERKRRQQEEEEEKQRQDIINNV